MEKVVTFERIIPSFRQEFGKKSLSQYWDVSYVIRELADSILSSLLRYQMFHKIYRFFESSKIHRKRHFYYWFDTFAEKGLVMVRGHRNSPLISRKNC